MKACLVRVDQISVIKLLIRACPCSVLADIELDRVGAIFVRIAHSVRPKPIRKVKRESYSGFDKGLKSYMFPLRLNMQPSLLVMSELET